MRRLLLGPAVVLLSSWLASTCHAQVGANTTGLIPTDPIQFYYGYYLPRQAAAATQPSAEATINAITADRQRYAATNRGTLNEPQSPFALDSDPFSGTGPGRGPSGALKSRSGPSTTSVVGSGPGGYYNRVTNFYPAARAGKSGNRNVAQTKGRGGMGGGMGMGGGIPGGGGFGPR